MNTKLFVLFVLLLNAGSTYAFENFDQAFSQMRQRYSIGHYKRTIAIYPDTLELSKTPTQKFNALYYKGLALNSLQKFLQAEQVFKKASTIKNISQTQRMQAHYNQIRSQYANKHFTSVLATAEKYSKLSKKPSVLELNILLTAIEAARQLNKNKKALALAEKMTKNTDKDSAWHYRGIIIQVQILTFLKDYNKAKQVMGKVDINKIPSPMCSEFLAWCGFCYEKDNQPESAAKLYSLAYKDYSSYYSALAALRHANLLDRMGGDDKEIVLKYTKVLELKGANSKHKSQAIYKIACIYNKQKKTETAMRYLAQIKDLKSPSVYWQSKIYNLHGDILYKKGKMAMAKQYYKDCLKLFHPPKDSKLYASKIIAQMEEKTTSPRKNSLAKK